MDKSPHIPVLYREIVAAFSACEEGVIIDCTMGYGGHSVALLDTYPSVRVIGIDQDETAIEFCKQRLAGYGERMQIRKGRFSQVIADIFAEVGTQNICGVLADIGVSSLQLDHKERGFSFESDTLDMRMDSDAPLSAAEVVNHYDVTALEQVFRAYGEMRNARQVAAAIVAKRPFDSAHQLADAVKPYAPRGKKIHPATLLMQAVRIEVNDELGELKRLLDVCEQACLPHAMIGIISFHSLEDRIVKQRFVAWSKRCICPSEAPRCTCGNDHALGNLGVKKPITARDDELRENPRSRSAKLRLFEMACHER